MKSKMRSSLPGLLFLAPAIILFALFVVYPIIYNVQSSLLEWDGVFLFFAKAVAAVATLAIAFTAWRIREVPQEPEIPHTLHFEATPLEDDY